MRTASTSTPPAGGTPLRMFACERCGLILLDPDTAARRRWTAPAGLTAGPGSCSRCGGELTEITVAEFARRLEALLGARLAVEGAS